MGANLTVRVLIDPLLLEHVDDFGRHVGFVVFRKYFRGFEDTVHVFSGSDHALVFFEKIRKNTGVVNGNRRTAIGHGKADCLALPALQAAFGDKAADAAEAMRITASHLKDLGVIDRIVKEPLGGAHKEPDEVAQRIADCIENQLEELGALETDALLDRRYQRLLSYGAFQD